MTFLTHQGLSAHASTSSIVAEARTALALQKSAQFMDMWHRHRHVCENYSPYRPSSPLPPGKSHSESNTECTGWEFYTWGVLQALPQLLLAQEQI